MLPVLPLQLECLAAWAGNLKSRESFIKKFMLKNYLGTAQIMLFEDKEENTLLTK